MGEYTNSTAIRRDNSIECAGYGSEDYMATINSYANYAAAFEYDYDQSYDRLAGIINRH